MKRGKKYTEAAKLVDRATQYDVAEAISLVTTRRRTSSCVSSTAVSMPSTVTVPEVGTSIPLNSFAMVDLPQPLWPSSATNEPFSMSRSTPCRASPLSSLYEKCRSLHSINAILSLPFQKSPVIPARPTRLPCCRRAEQAPFPSPASRFHRRKHSRRTSGAAKRRADTP